MSQKFWARALGLLVLGSIMAGSWAVPARLAWGKNEWSFGTNVPIDVLSTGYTCSSSNRSLWVVGDTLYVAYYVVNIREVLLAKSSDAGVTWSTPVVVNNNSLLKDSPVIAVDGQYVYVLWEGYTILGGIRTLYLSRSTNGGNTFEAPIQVTDSASPTDQFPNMDIGPSGGIYVVWETVESGGRDIWMSSSSDRGLSWTAPQQVDDTFASDGYTQNPDVAVDTSGVIHVVWAESVTGGRSVFYSAAPNAASPFGTPVTVTPTPMSNSYISPSIDTDGGGTVYIAWSAVPPGLREPDILFAKSVSGGSFSTPVIISDPPSDNNSHLYPSLRTFGTGRIAVAWMDDRLNLTYHGVYFASSVDGGTSFSCNSPVDDDMGVSYYDYDKPSVGVNDKGQAFVAFAVEASEYRMVSVRGHPNKWVRSADNPILSPGSPGSWDDVLVSFPCVMKTADRFLMWYTGYDGSDYNIGRAVSTDGVNWTKDADPVIRSGSIVPYAADGVLKASIIRSPDGFQAWVAGRDGLIVRILYYTSPDSRNWTPGASGPVLDVGAPGAWDSGYVFPCSVIRNGDLYQMWYIGEHAATHETGLGYATSSNGVSWTRYAGNPVFTGVSGSWENGLDFAHVMYRGGQYQMFYGGYGSPAKFGFAVSSDGVNWNRAVGSSATWSQTDTPWFGPVGDDWERHHVRSPFVISDSAQFMMYYTASDVSDFRLGHRIGLAVRTFDQSEWAVDNVSFSVSPGATAAEYQMKGIPLGFDNPGAANVLGPAVGTYDPLFTRIGRWDPASGGYKEYPDCGSLLTGWAGWFLSRNGLSKSYTGYTRRGFTLRGYLGLGWQTVPIQPGWNQVSNPYNHAVDLDGVIVASNTQTNVWLLASNNSITQPAFWSYSGGGYVPTAALPAGGAGWVRNLTAVEQYLQFPDTVAAFASRSPDGSADDLERPPAPPGGLDGESSSGGGGGGCFIRTCR